MTEVLVPVMETTFVTVRISDNDLERRDRLARNRQCLICEDAVKNTEPYVLGCCRTCINSVYYQIRAKKTTRQRLIKRGRLLDRGRRGRKFKNEHTKSIADI